MLHDLTEGPGSRRLLEEAEDEGVEAHRVAAELLVLADFVVEAVQHLSGGACGERASGQAEGAGWSRRPSGGLMPSLHQAQSSRPGMLLLAPTGHGPAGSSPGCARCVCKEGISHFPPRSRRSP